MNRKEIVFRKLGCDAINGERSFTQLALSRELGISLSAVNGAVKELKEVNAVAARRRGFDVVALDRLLLYWATHRGLKRDIAYQTRAEMPIRDIERSMPDGVAFTGYTGYRFTFDEAPADYSEVYLYATESALEQIKKRFGPSERQPNLIVMRCDDYLGGEISKGKLDKSSVCPAQLFADLWNMGQWYAKDFVDALSKRLGI